MFQLAERPVHMPGHTLTGDTRGPVVDTGVDLNGWVYLSLIEAVEVGKTVGMVEQQVHGQALETIVRLEQELAEATELVAAEQARQMRVVSVDELLDVHQAAPAAPARRAKTRSTPSPSSERNPS